MPFIFNTITKVAATWFGPKGRNVVMMLFLIAFYIPLTIEEFAEVEVIQAGTELTIASGVVTLISWFMPSQPLYSPTMSEEEKFIAGPKPYKEQLSELLSDKNYLTIAFCAAFTLASNNLVHNVLEIVDNSIHN